MSGVTVMSKQTESPIVAPVFSVKFSAKSLNIFTKPKSGMAYVKVLPATDGVKVPGMGPTYVTGPLAVTLT